MKRRFLFSFLRVQCEGGKRIVLFEELVWWVQESGLNWWLFYCSWHISQNAREYISNKTRKQNKSTKTKISKNATSGLESLKNLGLQGLHLLPLQGPPWRVQPPGASAAGCQACSADVKLREDCRRTARCLAMGSLGKCVHTHTKTHTDTHTCVPSLMWILLDSCTCAWWQLLRGCARIFSCMLTNKTKGKSQRQRLQLAHSRRCELVLF